jgi:hypothetical protein
VRSRVDRWLRRVGLRPPMPAFLHVPKTGGTYLVQREGDRDPVVAPIRYLGHSVVTASGARPEGYPPRGLLGGRVIPIRQLAGYRVFATVRNPFPFLVSYYFHCSGRNPKYDDPQHYDYELGHKDFDYFLKALSERLQPWPSRRLIHTQLFSYEGDLVADWLNRTDTLDDDLEEMARAWGLAYRRRERQRVGVKDDYRSYYTDALIDLVNHTWGREMKLFGFGWEKSDPASAILGRSIPPQVKRQVRYRWSPDELTVGGVVVPQ